MRILLDECAPRKLKAFLKTYGHQCQTVQDQGWSGIQNGELLARAETSFDLLITTDKGVQYQQNLAAKKLAIVIIRARTNRLIDLEPLFPTCVQALTTIRPGQVIEISAKKQ